MRPQDELIQTLGSPQMRGIINELAHDLKGASNKIKLFSELLLDPVHSGSLSQEAHECAEIINRTSSSLSSLLDGIFLSLSIEGHMPESEAIDARQVILGEFEQLREKYKSEKCTAEISELPLMITDRYLFSKLCHTIIDHSFRVHVRGTSLKVQVKAKLSKDRVFIHFMDNNDGFAKPGSRPRSMEMWVTICQKIMSKLQGRMRVFSKLNLGTRMTFSLPMI